MALAGRLDQSGVLGQVLSAVLDMMNPSPGRFGVTNWVNPAADKETGANLPARPSMASRTNLQTCV